jgi:hypothetical protein
MYHRDPWRLCPGEQRALLPSASQETPMLAFRIALAGAMAILVAPAAALATNADGATPTATPLLVELAVAIVVVGGLLARRPFAHLLRAAVARFARRRVGRASTVQPHHPRR